MNEKIGNLMTILSGSGSLGTGFFAFLAINGSVIAICLTIIAGTVTIISGIYAIYSKNKRNKESDSIIKLNKLNEKLITKQIEVADAELAFKKIEMNNNLKLE
jgi:hypothetical protein